LDGEIVIRDADSSPDFTLLQARLGLGPRRALEASRQNRASLVAFDLLELAGQDLRAWPLRLRRDALERLFTAQLPDLELGHQTDDAEIARAWLASDCRFEGVVAKRDDGRYRPGRRDWVKVKRHYSVDCVVVGAALAQRGPVLVLSHFKADGDAHIESVD
jgi:ATP-dependent DNA ligase